MEGARILKNSTEQVFRVDATHLNRTLAIGGKE